MTAEECGYGNQQTHDEDKPYAGPERRQEGVNEALSRRGGELSPTGSN